MSNANEKADGLYACFDGEQCCVRVHGRGSFKVSANLKAFIARSIEENGTRHVRIDLRECIGMDSTFMGVTAGLSGRLKKKGVSLMLVNLDEKNVELLKTLGIDQVVQYKSTEEGAGGCVCKKDSNACAVDLSEPQEDNLTTAETMLTAHQTLSDLHADNVDRFKNVINFLEQDVRKLKE